MRWLSCSIAPEVYQICRRDPDRNFPDASTLTFVWNAIEDMVLSAWLQYLHKLSLEHISLHFDGVRIYGGLPADIQQLCQDCAAYIQKETGFVVKIHEKKHETIADALLTRATSSVNIGDEA